jgi:hypothetical protein
MLGRWGRRGGYWRTVQRSSILAYDEELDDETETDEELDDYGGGAAAPRYHSIGSQ